MTIKPRSPWPSGVFSRDPSSLTMHFQYLPAVCRVVICNYTFFPAFCCISKPLCCSPNSTEGSGAQIIKFLSSSSPKIVLGKHSRCHRDHNSIPWISLLFSTIMHATSICDSHLEPEVLPGTALNHQQEGVWERNAPAFFFFFTAGGTMGHHDWCSVLSPRINQKDLAPVVHSSNMPNNALHLMALPPISVPTVSLLNYAHLHPYLFS